MVELQLSSGVRAFSVSFCFLFAACGGGDNGDGAGGAPPMTGAGGLPSAGAGGSAPVGGSSPMAGSAGASGGSSGGVAGTGGTAGGGRGGTAGAAGSAGTAGAAAGLPWLRVVGNQIQNPAGRRVILRGVSTVDLGVTEEWEGGLRQMIDRLTNKTDTQGGSPGWYPTVIRLAIYPVDGEVEGPIHYDPANDQYYTTILRPIVDYLRQKGVYAIIDWHHIGDTNVHRASTAEFWTDMSAKFANDSHVLFELFNEPINDGEWATVRSDMQAWYDIVRARAPQNLVLVGTPNWSQQLGGTVTNPIVGTNVAYVGHIYPIHWSSQNLRNQIVQAAAVHPVFMTEWGFEQNGDEIVDGTATSYGTPYKQFVEQNGLSWTAWCASSSWFPSIFNDDYSLRVGEGQMGGFLKAWLYEKRSADLPTAP